MFPNFFIYLKLFAFRFRPGLRAIFLIFLIHFGIIAVAVSQEFKWKLGLVSFFDNYEFAGSAFQIPQTLAGVVLSPEAGLAWDSVNRIGAGIHLMHEFGSINTIDKITPTAYYIYNKEPWVFLMGAFPRDNVLGRYPRVFFRDSLAWYRPNINGMFWEVKRDNNYLNLWLDWTGRITETEREAFFMGFSGRYNAGIFFVQHFTTMHHFAITTNPPPGDALHDNILMLTGAGLDLSGRTFFDNLEFSAGWVTGLERARASQAGWMQMNGILFETRIRYRFLNLFNSYYTGDGLFINYNEHKNRLYWGDPMYQAGRYNRSDLFIKFLQTGKVSMDLIYSLHFAESDIYHEQVLKLSINLNNY